MPSELPPFPRGYKPQKVRLANAATLVELPASEIAQFFREHPEAAQDLLNESYDKRFTPSTFIEEHDGGYRVGWYSNKYECLQTFSNFADAATDYLMFSLGKGRFTSTGP